MVTLDPIISHSRIRHKYLCNYAVQLTDASQRQLSMYKLDENQNLRSVFNER